MLSDAERAKLLYKIALAYYEDNLSQKEIAQRFGLSRIKVSRLLSECRATGIVDITITSPGDPSAALERQLQFQYGLKEATVVPIVTDDKSVLTRSLGAAAARSLARSLQGVRAVTLTWGTTLLATVDALPKQSWPHLVVVQCLGGLGAPDADIHGVELAQRLARVLDARPRILPAPGIVRSRMVRDALLTEAQISDTLALAARADVALMGIGVTAAPDSVVRLAGTVLTEAEIGELEAKGAVGDIALRFFDAKGRPVKHAINDRVVGLELEQIRRIPRIIGVAGGIHKVDAIRGALRSKLINVLVTDEDTATRLLATPE
jgi:DNA-binding transcriptional regulator LsrR (DeoR family)